MFWLPIGSKNVITIAKTPWAPLDIQKSKLTWKNDTFQAKEKHVYLVFYTRLNKMSCEKNFHEGNWTWGHKCKIIYFSHSFFTNCKGKWFFTTKHAKISKNFYCSTSSILKFFWMNLIYLTIFSRLPFILFFTIEFIFVLKKFIFF